VTDDDQRQRPEQRAIDGIVERAVRRTLGHA
jgi:hypothetical protein